MAEQKRGTALSKTRGLFLSGYYYDRVVWGSGVSFVVVIALLVAFQARFEINLEKTILLTELSGLFASLALAVPIVARDDNEGNLLRRALLLLATTFVLSTIVSFAGALSTSGPAEVKLTVFGFAVLALVALPTSTLHTLIPRFEFSTGLLLFLSAIPTNFSAVIVGLVMFLWGAVQLVALVLVLAFRGRVANDPSTSVMSMIQSILEDEVRRTLSAQEILRKLAARAIFVSPDALQALLGTMNAEVNPEKPRLVRLAHDKYIASWRSEYHDRIVSRLPGILDSPSFRDAMERDGDTTYRRIGAAAGLSEELVKAYPDLQGILETGYVIVRLSPDAALVRKDLAESIRAMFDSADSLRNFFKAFQSCEALLGQEADDSGSNVGRICEEISLQSLDAPPGRFSNLVTQAVFELLRVIPAECSKISQLVKEAFGSYTPELMSSLRTRSFQKIVDGGVDQLIRAGTIEDCDIKRPLPEGESDIARPLRMMSPDKGIRRTHPGP